MHILIYVEIPEGSSVKYELDEKEGRMTIDRLLPTAMNYPTNYGLILETMGEDGDALDAMLFMSQPINPEVTVKCKVIGLLEMEDEEGIDHKIIAVPLEKIDPICGSWNSLDDIPHAKKEQIRHFFEHYKDLEKEKWVKLRDWKDIPEALIVLNKAKSRYQKK